MTHSDLIRCFSSLKISRLQCLLALLDQGKQAFQMLSEHTREQTRVFQQAFETMQAMANSASSSSAAFQALATNGN